MCIVFSVGLSLSKVDFGPPACSRGDSWAGDGCGECPSAASPPCAAFNEVLLIALESSVTVISFVDDDFGSCLRCPSLTE